MSTAWQAFVYGAIVGFASGGIMTVSAVIWPAYYGRRHLGSIRGAATTSMVAGAALGPLPFAFAFEAFGAYTRVLAVFIMFPVVSLAAAYFARPPVRP
jgi:MFS family permease